MLIFGTMPEYEAGYPRVEATQSQRQAGVKSGLVSVLGVSTVNLVIGSSRQLVLEYLQGVKFNKFCKFSVLASNGKAMMFELFRDAHESGRREFIPLPLFPNLGLYFSG